MISKAVGKFLACRKYTHVIIRPFKPLDSESPDSLVDETGPKQLEGVIHANLLSP